MGDLIDRDALIARLTDWLEDGDDEDLTPAERQYNHGIKRAIRFVKATSSVPITGDTSDGYHTFNELYHHRAVLFSVLVRIYRDRAWKSRLHSDGTMYDGMFIVGINTPDGQTTYHCDIDPYWDMFDCAELPNAPEWDGHTPAQAIERIGKLKPPSAFDLLYARSHYAVEAMKQTVTKQEDS